MKLKGYLKLTFAIVVVLFGGFVYSSIFGNPVSYLKAKSGIEQYVSNTYPQLLKVDSIHYSWKDGAYYADVVHKEDSRYTSSIGYTNYGNIIDYYESDVEYKMSDEIMAMLQLMILHGSSISENEMSLTVKLDLKTNQCTLKDKYSGKEPFSVDIWLHGAQDFESKEGSFSEKPLYDNQADFAKDVYGLIKVLQAVDYPYEDVKIYSYLADGNTSYEFQVSDVHQIKRLEQVNQLINVMGSSKEEPIK